MEVLRARGFHKVFFLLNKGRFFLVIELGYPLFFVTWGVLVFRRESVRRTGFVRLFCVTVEKPKPATFKK